MVDIMILSGGNEGSRFKYTDPASGEVRDAVQEGNSLYTQEGTHLCDLHYNPADALAPVRDVRDFFRKEPPKLSRSQRRSQKGRKHR